MENKFTSSMVQLSDSELLKVVTIARNDYQPEAIEAAEIELKNRNLSVQKTEEVIKENEALEQIKIDKANKELGITLKVLSFIFPGIIQVLFSRVFKADGYDRKARELLKWTFYGFGFYLGIVILIIILSRIA
jgi:hypothetical protein